MKTTVSCVYCQIGTAMRLLKKFGLSEEEEQKQFQKVLGYFANCDYSMTPPELHVPVWEIARRASGQADPIKEERRKDNERVMALLPSIKKRVAESADPYLTAMKYAIAGNVIDPLPQHGVSVDEAFDAVLNKPLFIDHSARLRQLLESGAKVLYVTDNAGEIVLDRLFLETLFSLNITKPQNITLAVKGRPANNDATMEDAAQVGLTGLVTVIDTGDDTMGITLSRSGGRFLEAFYGADVIVAKGMGNYESLSDYREKLLCHMLMVKCENVSGACGAPQGEFICMFNL